MINILKKVCKKPNRDFLLIRYNFFNSMNKIISDHNSLSRDEKNRIRTMFSNIDDMERDLAKLYKLARGALTEKIEFFS